MTEEESPAARTKADQSHTEAATLEYEIKKAEGKVHPEMMGEESGLTQTMRKAQTEYEKRNAEEALKGVLLADKNRIIADKSKGSLGARLTAQLAKNETLNEAAQGFEQAGMYKNAEKNFHKVVEKIESAVGADGTMTNKSVEREKIGKELGTIKTNLEQNDQQVAEIINKLSPELGAVLKTAFASAIAGTANLDILTGENDEEYAARRKAAASKLFMASVDSSVKIPEEKQAAIEQFGKFGVNGMLQGRVDQESRNESLGAAYREKNREVLVRRAEIIEGLGDQGEIPAWQAARAQAEREHTSTFYRSARKHTMNQAAQAYIWDRHGITIPNDGETEAIEATGKSFTDMNYEMSVGAFETQHEQLREKIANGGEVTFEEKVVAMANFKRLIKESWVDDITVPTQERLMKERKRFAKMYKELLGSAGSPGAEVKFAADMKIIERMSKRSVVSVETGGDLTGDRLDRTGELIKGMPSDLSGLVKTALENMRSKGKIDDVGNLLEKLKQNMNALRGKEEILKVVLGNVRAAVFKDDARMAEEFIKLIEQQNDEVKVRELLAKCS